MSTETIQKYPQRQRPRATCAPADRDQPAAPPVVTVRWHGWQPVPQGFAGAIGYLPGRGVGAWAIRTYRTVEPVQVLRNGAPERAAGSVVTIQSLEAEGYKVLIVPDDFQAAMLAAEGLYVNGLMDSPGADLDDLMHAERCLLAAQACLRDRILTLRAKGDGVIERYQ